MSSKRLFSMLAAVGVLATGAIVAPVVAATPAAAAAPIDCGPYGILTQYDASRAASTVTRVDLATGASEAQPDLPNAVNGAGYNILDNNVYLWDYENQSLGRFGADSEYEVLSLPAGMEPRNWNVGDVDSDGFLWMMATGGDYNWVQIDARPDSATFLEVLNSGTTPRYEAVPSPDWVAVPGHDDVLYSLGSLRTDRTQNQLIAWDKATGVATVVADLGVYDGRRLGFGAQYTDADGFMYGSDNTTGDIFRVDIEAGTLDFFSTGPASTVNDGAYCPLRVQELDFGDAPDSYGSSLATDGPRHTLLGFANDEAPLMLGSSVTRETDAVVGDEDFDDALASEPSVTATLPTTVDVAVTNNGDSDAVLTAWFDADLSGTFEASEALPPVDVAAGSGSGTVALEIPAATAEGDSWLRLRLGNTAAEAPTGPIAGGEVEDWFVNVSAPVGDIVVDKAVSSDMYMGAGETLDYTVTVTNNGDTTLTGLEVTDPLCELEGDLSDLAVGESRDFTCSYETTAEDVEEQFVVNVAEATAMSGGELVSDEGTATAAYAIEDVTTPGPGDPTDPVDPADPGTGPEEPSNPGDPADRADPEPAAAGSTTGSKDGSLADTGSQSLLPWLIGGGVLLLAGAALTLGRLKRRRS